MSTVIEQKSARGGGAGGGGGILNQPPHIQQLTLSFANILQ